MACVIICTWKEFEQNNGFRECNMWNPFHINYNFTSIHHFQGFPGRGLINVTHISATFVPVGPVLISGGGMSS